MVFLQGLGTFLIPLNYKNFLFQLLSPLNSWVLDRSYLNRKLNKLFKTISYKNKK